METNLLQEVLKDFPMFYVWFIGTRIAMPALSLILSFSEEKIIWHFENCDLFVVKLRLTDENNPMKAELWYPF